MFKVGDKVINKHTRATGVVIATEQMCGMRGCVIVRFDNDRSMEGYATKISNLELTPKP